MASFVSGSECKQLLGRNGNLQRTDSAGKHSERERTEAKVLYDVKLELHLVVDAESGKKARRLAISELTINSVYAMTLLSDDISATEITGRAQLPQGWPPDENPVGNGAQTIADLLPA